MSNNKNVLQTEKKYVKDLFSAESFYNIPDYQRPYVWGKEQVYELLNDVWKAMEQNQEKEYFLGCMIWNTKEVVDKKQNLKYQCQDILDGQQRFITLYLLLGVLRDLSKNEQLKKQTDAYLRQEHNVFENTPERRRIEFSVRDDNDFFDEYLFPRGKTAVLSSKDTIFKHKSTSFRAMLNAVCSMREWWKEKSKELGDDYQEYILLFSVYLFNKVLVLYLATPDSLDDAYNLFTVLNSRGMQLQASDILKAQNLRAVDDDAERKEYAKKWVDYENRIESPYSSLDNFLNTIVVIKNKYQGEETKNLNKAFEFIAAKKLLHKGKDTFA